MSVVHRTYARSLFEAAKEAGRLPAVREELADFVEAMRQVPELRELLAQPAARRAREDRGGRRRRRATPTRSSATCCGS